MGPLIPNCWSGSEIQAFAILHSAKADPDYLTEAEPEQMEMPSAHAMEHSYYLMCSE